MARAMAPSASALAGGSGDGQVDKSEGFVQGSRFVFERGYGPSGPEQYGDLGPSQSASLIGLLAGALDAASLDGRPLRPAWLGLQGDDVLARFAAPVVLAETGIPWINAGGHGAGEGGGIDHTWRLPRSTPLDRLIDARSVLRSETLVAVTERLFVDPVAAGRVMLLGPAGPVSALARSMSGQLSRLSSGLSTGEGAVQDAGRKHGPTELRTEPPTEGREPEPSDRLLVAPGVSVLPGGFDGLRLTVGTQAVVLEDSWPSAPGGAEPASAHPGSSATVRSIGRRYPGAGGPTSTGEHRHSLLNRQQTLFAAGTEIAAGLDRPEVRLLGPIEWIAPEAGPEPEPASAATKPPTPQQLALIACLICLGPTDGATLADALWDGELLSAGRFPNLLAEVRNRIGRRHLPPASAGCYRIDGIATDLERFERMVGQEVDLKQRSTAELLTAMDLVRGVPLAGSSGKYWRWIDAHPQVVSRLDGLVVAGANRVANVCLDRGEPEAAVTAYQRGLVASPLDEGLVTALVALLAETGRLGAAVQQLESWEARVRALGCGEPSPGPRSVLGSTGSQRPSTAGWAGRGG